MIIDLFLQNPIGGLILFSAIVLAISVHEAAHAYVATFLGDDTPRLQGRLTLNPKAHLDTWGTLLIIFIGIGWGKPVMFNPYNLRNPRRDTALISLAGPASNLIIAGLVAFITSFIPSLGAMAYLFVFLNVALAIFNLIPIEPLDGFKVVSGILPQSLVMDWEETRKYGLIVLLILLFTGAINKIVFPIVTRLTMLIM